MHRFFAFIATIVALCVAVPATAATTVNLTGSSTSSGNSLLYTSGAVHFSATALTYTNSLIPTVSAAIKYTEGLGVNPSGDNRHTVDNSGAYDFILLRFDQAVSLNGATFTNLNWFNDSRPDTDATISYMNLNYSAIGQTYTTNLTNTAKTNFFNAAALPLYANGFSSDTNTSGTSTRSFNTGVNPNVGTIWIIGASISNLDQKIDSFKLKSISYDLPDIPPSGGGAVPEPATWALLILGMGTIGAAMRRQKRAHLTLA